MALQRIDLSHNTIDLDDWGRLNSVLLHGSLQDINLRRTSLGDQGLAAIAPGLKAAAGRRLARINLSDTCITEHTAAPLARAFEKSPSLTELDVSWNSLKESVLHLLNIPNLRALNASFCPLGSGIGGRRRLRAE